MFRKVWKESSTKHRRKNRDMNENQAGALLVVGFVAALLAQFVNVLPANTATLLADKFLVAVIVVAVAYFMTE